MTKATISSKGQIAIPKAVRERLNLKAGTEISIEVQGEVLVMRPLTGARCKEWCGEGKACPRLWRPNTELNSSLGDDQTDNDLDRAIVRGFRFGGSAPPPWAIEAQ
jgi:AbrB family looped-hinge helix DNA binding protein